MERPANLKKTAEAIQLALNLAESFPDAYLRAQPDMRKLWNKGLLPKDPLVRTGPSAQADAVHDDRVESTLDERPKDGLEEGGFFHCSLRSFVSAGDGVAEAKGTL
jgi:hypothetical protein